MPRRAFLLWVIIAAFWTFDATGFLFSQMRLIPNGNLASFVGAMVALISIALIYFRSGRSDSLMRVSHSLAQLFALLLGAELLSMFVTAIGGPLVDSSLARMDRALGFDGDAWYAWEAAHPTVFRLLAVVYMALIPEAALCTCYLAARKSSDEFIGAIAISLAMTLVIACVVPAAGSVKTAEHVPYFLALRHGAVSGIDVGAPKGLISFPSFHTTLALLVVYAVRRQRVLFLCAIALNALLLVSVPNHGGHYLVDMLAGGVVAVLSLRIVSWIGELSPSAAPVVISPPGPRRNSRPTMDNEMYGR